LTLEQKTPSPSYVIDERLLLKNLKILDDLKSKSGAKILLALKGYAFFSTFGLVREYLDGACASGLYEAKLAREEINKEVHTYSPAFKENEFKEIAKISDYIVFNSISQLKKYSKDCKNFGLRVNPQVSFAPKELYDPCSLNSRLGVNETDLIDEDITGISGLHFHALCEESAESLEKVLQGFENRFSKYLKGLKWVNFGGGHHITKEGYNIALLISLIKDFKNRYGVEVYLEPGEAIGWRCGYFVATVLDVIKKNNLKIAIIDASIETHLPDCLIVPYKPEIIGSIEYSEHKYLIGGNSCLAGDYVGEYYFADELKIGSKIVFGDMAHYTHVKNTTFNGIGLPSLCKIDINGNLEVVKSFGYSEYKNRLS
jgi:carboxynorspermidine decarboxylase